MKTALQMIESFGRFQIKFADFANRNVREMRQNKLPYAEKAFTEWTRKQVLAQCKTYRLLDALRWKENLPEDLQKKESALFAAFTK